MTTEKIEQVPDVTIDDIDADTGLRLCIHIFGRPTSVELAAWQIEELHLTSQYDQLLPENRIFCLKSALRLEWRGQNGQDEAEQSEHDPQTLGDSFI